MLLTWIIIGIAAIALELLTPTALISIWFSCGAAIALVLECFNVDMGIQIAAFFIVSFVTMLIVRPIATRYLRGNIVPTNADRFIGETGVVSKRIEEDMWGEVYVKSTYWHAVEVDGKSIEEKTKVKILAIDGAKLIVKQL